MKTFKHWGKEATRSPTRRTSRFNRWDDPDYRGDFDDIGNERIERAYHMQRMAKRGLLFG